MLWIGMFHFILILYIHQASWFSWGFSYVYNFASKLGRWRETCPQLPVIFTGSSVSKVKKNNLYLLAIIKKNPGAVKKNSCKKTWNLSPATTYPAVFNKGGVSICATHAPSKCEGHSQTVHIIHYRVWRTPYELLHWGNVSLHRSPP